MTISSRSSRLGLLTGAALLASGLAASHASGAEPVRLTAAQLDTVVAGVSSGTSLIATVDLVSPDNRLGGIVSQRTRSSLLSSTSSGSIVAWGIARGPGATAAVTTDGAGVGAYTSRFRVNVRGGVPGLRWAASATAVGAANVAVPQF